ncbi:glycosyltransferase [Mesobacillus subterraneus]|uniref:glycosyltransferase n=1 Tax=Mesobacillus subterraneus TaxID=285983 RepID=UPI00203DFACD|nr:glycosyltransferase [Mesobacillus subterraneus]MCM3574704.1 glycosyltransferase [Mesobacillus subterraneus]
MKKKKVLFMVISMNVGGTEKALLNMISMMPKKEYDITIQMLEKKGGFIKSIPEWVKIKTLDEYKKIKEILNDPPPRVIMGLLKKRKLLTAFIMLILYSLTHLTKERSILYQYLLRNIRFKEEYDVAVAYAGPMDFISYFVVKKIKAKLKYQWIHFDITKVGFNPYFARKIYRKFNNIFVVSKEGQTKLLNTIPNLKNKTETFYNVLLKEEIQRMADQGQGFQDNFNGIRILTVGRLSIEKGQDITIPVLSKLRHEGYDVKWYCIGEGKARKEYEKLISDFNVRNEFILLGTNPNPYPFMKECDLYVQPSRHEGYCITLGEAMSLNIPIICTDFTGAKEQIKHNINGVLVNFNQEQLYQEIKRIIDDKKFRKELIENSKSLSLNSNKEKSKIKAIF